MTSGHEKEFFKVFSWKTITITSNQKNVIQAPVNATSQRRIPLKHIHYTQMNALQWEL